MSKPLQDEFHNFDPRQELERLIEFVTLVIAEVEAGEIRDLHGLDGRVETVCKAVESLPRDEVEQVRNRFEHLNSQLELLSSALASRKRSG